MYSTLCTVKYVQYSMCSTVCAVQYVQYIMYSTVCAVLYVPSVSSTNCDQHSTQHCLLFSTAHSHYSPLALQPTRTITHSHYSPLALQPTRTTVHSHYSPLALQPTRTTTHSHYNPLALFTLLYEIKLEIYSKFLKPSILRSVPETLCNVGFPVPCFLIYKVTVSLACTFVYFAAKY